MRRAFVRRFRFGGENASNSGRLVLEGLSVRARSFLVGRASPLVVPAADTNNRYSAVGSKADLDEAVRLDYKSVAARLTRAFVQEERGIFFDALDDYKNVLFLEPKNLLAKAGVERTRQAQQNTERLEKLVSQRQSLPAALSSDTRANASPGFDCKRAFGRDELAVCSSAELASLDRELNTVFRRLRAKLNPKEAQALTQAQMEWLRQRGRCQSDEECIGSLYCSILSEMQNWHAQQE